MQILVVESKQAARDSVAMTLQRAGYDVFSAADADAAAGLRDKAAPTVIITGFCMTEAEGQASLTQVRASYPHAAVIVVSATASVEAAVLAMRGGAVDFIGKPFQDQRLLDAVCGAADAARGSQDDLPERRHGAADHVGGGPLDAAPDTAAPPPAPARAAAARRSPRTLFDFIPKSGSQRSAKASHTSTQRLPAHAANPVAPTADAKPSSAAPAMIGRSRAMQQAIAQLKRIARSRGAVLIHGESGVGKEVAARFVHAKSPRARRPMVALNCAALSGGLLESELFGHERGAFTGADQLRKGRFESAHQSSLLLDEITEIPSALQAKLLRVLQEGQFERVGSSQSMAVDVRLIAATNRDLAVAVADGTFRQDLYYRLNVLPVHLPPLRNRAEDVPLLATHFLNLVAAREDEPVKQLTEAAMRLLQAYHWPGNVRELQNICHRAAVLCVEPMIDAALIEPWLVGLAAPGGHSAGGDMGTAGGEAVIATVDRLRPWEAKTTQDRLGALLQRHGRRLGHHRAGMDSGAEHWVGEGPVTPGQASRTDASPQAPGGHANSEADATCDAGCESPACPRRRGHDQHTASDSAGSPPPVKKLEDLERETIVATLNRFSGNRKRTAEALGIAIRTLGLKLKKWKSQDLVDESL